MKKFLILIKYAFLSINIESFTNPPSLKYQKKNNIKIKQYSASSSSSLSLKAVSKTSYSTRQSTSNDLLDIASFRNNCTSPSLMIQKQTEKNDSYNKISSMKDGILIGLGVGLIFSILSGISENSYDIAIRNFIYIGPILSILLGLNNLLGKRVYIMTLPQAENRLIVDFVAGLKAGTDIGFIAKVVPERSCNPIAFEQTNGIIGCLDCQIRPSKGVLPQHVYIKNVFVHECMRRCGVASALLTNVEKFCRQEHCHVVVLEVEDSNVSAIKFYNNLGYAIDSISNPMQGRKYGTSWVIGRSIMTKKV